VGSNAGLSLAVPSQLMLLPSLLLLLLLLLLSLCQV
jgi:hypothetical protein